MKTMSSDHFSWIKKKLSLTYIQLHEAFHKRKFYFRLRAVKDQKLVFLWVIF